MNEAGEVELLLAVVPIRPKDFVAGHATIHASHVSVQLRLAWRQAVVSEEYGLFFRRVGNDVRDGIGGRSRIFRGAFVVREEQIGVADSLGFQPPANAGFGPGDAEAVAIGFVARQRHLDAPEQDFGGLALGSSFCDGGGQESFVGG